jgi:hypothetical protein
MNVEIGTVAVQFPEKEYKNGIFIAVRCHFRAQKSLHFQGPPLPMALEMDLPASKSSHPAPYKQQVHNSYFVFYGVYMEVFP